MVKYGKKTRKIYYIKREENNMAHYIRKIDSMSRIVLPPECKKSAMLDDVSEAKITVQDGKIIIERITPACRICRSEEELDEKFRICQKCMEAIKNEK